MPIDDKVVKDWGTIYPSDNSHTTITNKKSHDGPGCHITTEVIGGIKIRQDIDGDGNVSDPTIT